MSTLLLSFNSSAQLADGSVAPNFTITDLDGNQHELYEYLDQGYTVIVDLYAVWCGPCWNYHNTGTGHPNAGALKDLYNQYGPDGTDEVIVMGIESDPSTSAASISGGGNSIGDWTEGVPYIMANDDQIAGLYNLAYYPTVYGICPNRTVFEVGQASVADHYNFAQGCPEAIDGTDAALLESVSSSDLACGDYDLSVRLQNMGTEDLTSVSIEALIDGSVVASTDWSGSLSTYQIAEVEVGSATILEDSQVTFNVTSSDDNSANNTIESIVNASQLASSVITVKVITDYYAGETAWEIKDSQGNVIDSHSYEYGDEDSFGGGGPDANMTHEHEVTLGTDIECFTFTITDDYGDGIVYTPEGTVGNPADFGYEIIGSGGWEITSYTGDFTDEYSDGFRTDETSSVKDIAESKNQLSIYPNPTDGITNVNFDLAQASKVTMTVFNMVGQKVIAEDFGQMQAGQHADVLNMSELDPGVYLLNFNVNGESMTKRITLTR